MGNCCKAVPVDELESVMEDISKNTPTVQYYDSRCPNQSRISDRDLQSVADDSVSKVDCLSVNPMVNVNGGEPSQFSIWAEWN